ncbi:FtsX-like permease family protein [Agaribacter flavus]|uniref:FtsX-like permease family protein n=1 Tax=Agaribacter flavus TaxID=1902781 RepID=A0ABV7FMV9_9ALTE
MTYFVKLLAQGFQASQGQGFIRFVSKMSSIGVGLGCAALIILLSVMNGFENELRSKLLNLVPHAEFIQVGDQGIYLPDDAKSRLRDDPRLKQVFQLNKATALLQSGNKIKSAEVTGMNERYHAAKYAKVFDFSVLSPRQTESENDLEILLGIEVMNALDLQEGDKVQLLLPQTNQELSFKTPISAWFTVVGAVSLGGELDNFVAFVDNDDLAQLLNLHSPNSTHVEFQLHDPFLAQSFVREHGYQFDQAIYMSSWFLSKGHLYHDIQLVRVVIYIVLFLLICIACFNVVSSLVMSVKEKSKAIAILKTMGATQAQIRQIFILKGIRSTFIGALIGCCVGTLLSVYLPNIVNAVENLTGWTVLDAGIYFTSTIPSKVIWWNVLLTFSVAVTIGLFATLYPASKAANMQPTAHLS